MKYRVKVPATSANIGAGFDCMGIALSIYNIFEVEEIEEGLEFIGFDERFCDEENILYKSILYVLKKYSYDIKGFKISLVNQDIPVARGLGSSSTCIVAGVLIANKFLKDKLNKNEILKIVTELEGHPDNVVPAILGGFVVSVIVENGNLYYNKVDLDKKLLFLASIPEFELSTEKARGALPSFYSKKDGIYNISRAALASSAFATKKYELLKVACEDCFHEPYRSKFIEEYKEVKNILNKNGSICSFLSGAGPTILAIAIIDENNDFNTKNIKDDFNCLKNKWSLIKLKADNIGAVIEEG